MENQIDNNIKDKEEENKISQIKYNVLDISQYKISKVNESGDYQILEKLYIRQ